MGGRRPGPASRTALNRILLQGSLVGGSGYSLVQEYEEEEPWVEENQDRLHAQTSTSSGFLEFGFVSRRSSV